MGLLNNLFSLLFFMIPEDPWPVFADWFAAYLNDIAIKAMKALATAFWFLEKIAAGITRFFLEESMWDLVINIIFDQLRATLPQILSDVIAPTGTGPAAGLLYLALFLAGLLMVIPGIDHKRLIDPGRVLLWAVIIGVLFISNTTGYDIIGAIEKLRGDTTQIIIGANNRNLDDLVSDPMIASDSDLKNYSFVLSDPFENKYFQEPADFDNREAEIINSVLLYWKMDIKVETEASQRDRREKAQIGLAVAGLTIIGAIVLIMIAFILATLTASALILIMFFLISLPIGFFEFGSAILSGIARQYTYIWAITLLSAILPRILIAANSLAYKNGAANLTEIMGTIPILIIVAIATSYISAMAGKAMLDTFSVISTSISTAMAPLNYAGQMPQGGMLGGGPLQAGANLAGTAALAAVTGPAALASAGGAVLGTAALAGATGGSRAALMAGAGAIAGQVSQKGGQVAGGVAMGMMGEKANVFASAARGRGAAAVAQIAGNRYRRQKSQEEKEEQERQNLELKEEQARKAKSRKFSSQARAPQDDIPDQYKADLVNAGSYLTHDPTHINRAESAFKQKKYTTARHHLTKAFGSQEIANLAYTQYEKHGNLGVRKVRHIAQAARVTAQGMATRGQVLFGPKGNLNEGFSRRTLGLLDQSDSFDPDSQEDLALAAQISGATVRQPSDIWSDPFAAATLASHTCQSPENPHPYSQDPSATFALHDMAKGLGWGEQELEATFEATKEAQALGQLGEQPEVGQVVQRMNQHGELVGNSNRDKREVARLTLLVLGHAKKPVPVPPKTPHWDQAPPNYSDQAPPPNYSDQAPPPDYFDQVPPPNYSDQAPPPNYSDQVPPPNYSDQAPPPNYSDQVPPPNYSDQVPPPNYSDQVPPPNYSDQVPPPNYSDQAPEVQAPQAASQAQTPQTPLQVQVPQAPQAQVPFVPDQTALPLESDQEPPRVPDQTVSPRTPDHTALPLESDQESLRVPDQTV